MNESDKKLDALLRDVDVPDDLKTQLRQIPVESAVRPASSNPAAAGSRRVIWTVATLAASVVGLALFLFWPTTDAPPVAKGPAGDSHDRDQTAVWEGFQERMTDIEELLNEVELASLASQLEATKTEMVRVDIGAREAQSFVYGLADQAAVYFGASPESVRADMERVASRFPDTAGAAVAQQFLTGHGFVPN